MHSIYHPYIHYESIYILWIRWVFFTHMLISHLLIDETLDFYDIVIEECNGGLQT